MKFMKGKEAAAAVEADEKKKEEAKKHLGDTVYRFYMKEDTERDITFLDGDLNEDGMLDIPLYYEHQLQINGDWKNWIVCTAQEEPCPICEGGNKPQLVGLMSVIDHTPYTSSKGDVYKDRLMLYVVKSATIKKLTKKAQKYGGLTGLRFDVSRTDAKQPNVGDDFDFSSKSTLQEVCETYGVSGPIDYETVIVYKDAETLRNEGHGSLSVGHQDTSVPPANYDQDL